MDSTTPKISFIPKGSLVHDDPFLERQRPKSIIGFFAVFLFISVVSAYSGLYYYNNSLNRLIIEKTAAIKIVQEDFNNATPVSEAKIFRARADLASELLKKHTAVSPIIAFLEKNTMESIMYDKFSYKNDGGVGSIELSGEAPTYGSLSYQTDFLRKKSNELSKFSLSSFSLTPTGSINFAFAMTFNPGYLLYENNLKSIATPPATPSDSLGEDIVGSPIDTEGILDELSLIDAIPDDVATTTDIAEVVTNEKTVNNAVPQKDKPSVLRSLWEKFKFW